MARAKASPRAEPSATGVPAQFSWLAALTLVVLVPLVWDLGAFETFRESKSTLAAFAWIVLATAFLVSNLHGEAWRDPWWLAWAGVLAGGVLSSLTSGQAIRSLAALAPLALAALGWGALRQLSDERRRKLAGLVVWVGAAQAVVTITFVNPDWRPASFSLLQGIGGRYAWIGVMGNPADTGVSLVLPALLAVERAIALSRGRVVNVVAAFLMIGTIIGSQTLTALAALGVGLVLIVLPLVPRRRRIPTLAGAAALLVIVALVTPVRSRIRGAILEARADGVLGLANARAVGVGAAAGMVGARPLTGVGFGLFEANYFRVQSEKALAYHAQRSGLTTGWGEAHNDLLQHLAETGILGIALALAGIALAVRARPGTDALLPHALPLLGAAVTLSLAQFPLHLAAVAAQFTVLAALATTRLPAAPIASRGVRWARACTVATVAAAAAYVSFQQHSLSRAYREAKTLSEALRTSAPAARRREIARAVIERLEPRSRWAPYSWKGQVVLGNLAADAGQPQRALYHFNAALVLAERPELQFDLGMALLMAGDEEAGFDHLIKAVKLNPAIFREITDARLAETLRRRLDADGYGVRHTWMYDKTPAAK